MRNAIVREKLKEDLSLFSFTDEQEKQIKDILYSTSLYLKSEDKMERYIANVYYSKLYNLLWIVKTLKKE